MFTVVEIDKISPLFASFTPYAPYVYSSILAISPASPHTIANYWTTTFGASGDYNDVAKNITGVVLNTTFDVEEVSSLGDLLTQESSFYFDYDNQELYIHFPHFWTPEIVTIATGQGWGYCSDTVRYFRNQLYRPIVKSVPQLSDATDPLQYGIIAFGGGSVVMVNDGHFDVDEKLYGNNIRIKRGQEGDDYDDLILMFSGYIRDYTTTTQEFTIDIADKRERLQTKHPSEEIEILDKYVTGVGWEKKTVLLPDGYGDVIQVPAHPISTGGGKVVFRWGEKVTSISQVYTEGDTLTAVAHADFSTAGTFTLTNAQAGKDADPTKGLLKVYVTGKMRNITNPAEIIVDLNKRIFDVDYNNSNYDIMELEAEKALLASVALYMDKAKKVYEWIEDLQNGTNIGFRYEDTERRTIRLDLPTRPIVADIRPIDIRNSDMPIKRNAELYASSCLVKFGKNWRADSWQSDENKNWEQEVIDEHRVKKVQEYESLLMTKAEAGDKALRVMEDIHKVRPIFTLRVDSSKYPQPRVFDMVTAEVSLLDRKYNGSVVGQVIGVQWLIDTNEVEVEVREREVQDYDLSLLFTNTFVDIPSLSLLPTWTVIARVYHEVGFNPYEDIVTGEGGEQYPLILANGKLQAYDSGVTAPSQIPTESWVQVASSNDEATTSLYVNGALVAYKNTLRPSKPTTIGARPQRTGEWFNGLIADVKIYWRALTLQEIQDDYNGLDVTSGLIAHYPLDDGGVIAHDIVGGNDGMITNPRWVRRE